MGIHCVSSRTHQLQGQQHLPAARSHFCSPAALRAPGPPQKGPPPATGSGQWIGHGIPSPGRPAARTPWEVNLSALWGRGGGLGFGRKDFRRQEIGGWRSSGEHRKVYITQAFAGVKRQNLLHSRPGTEPLPLLIPATKQSMIGDTASCADRGIISC